VTEKTIKAIYIAGYGRSGSTLLDIYLGQHPDLVSGGELCNLLAWVNDKTRFQLCACGKKVEDCLVWGTVIKKIAELAKKEGVSLIQLEEVRRKLENRRELFLHRHSVQDRIAKGYQEFYKKIQQEIFSQLLHSKAGAKFVIDSSKTVAHSAARPMSLVNNCGFDLRVIHLVRDARSVVGSALKGRNRDLERGKASSVNYIGLRAALNWLLTNLGCDILQHKLTKSNFIRVRYEDLVGYPGVVSKKLGDFIGVSVNPLLTALRRESWLEEVHTFGGNRMRLRSIQLDKKKGDVATPLGYRLLCTVLCWPIF